MNLSVVLPVRNEEEVLPACLRSLVSQSEPGFELGREWEILVVNDDSTDRTREIAASHAVVTLIDAPPLDGGMNGKNNACWAGAERACGRWLLFTDADTVHEPRSLRNALREAEEHHASLLSYSPRQIVSGLWQRAVMPLIFAELTAVYPPGKVSNPESSIAAANGQFLMVEREAYFAIGGHCAQETNVLEDVALARAIKQSGRMIRFRNAPEALSTRMYSSTRAMIEGWRKNLALLLPRPVWRAVQCVIELAGFIGLPLMALFIPQLVPPQNAIWQSAVILLWWAGTIVWFYARTSKSGFPKTDVALSVLGQPLFTYMLIQSIVAHRRGSVTWKGRSYSVGPKSSREHLNQREPE